MATKQKIADPPTKKNKQLPAPTIKLVDLPTRKVTTPPNTPKIATPHQQTHQFSGQTLIKDSSPPKTAVFTWKLPDGTFADWMSWKSAEMENNFLYSFIWNKKKAAALEKKFLEIPGKEWIAVYDGR